MPDTTRPKTTLAVRLRASDYAASVGFYATILAPVGLTGDDHGGWTNFGDLLAITEGSPTTQGADVLVYVATEDHVAQSYAGAQQSGFTLLDAPHDDPPSSAYWASVTDPDGNRVFIVYERTELSPQST